MSFFILALLGANAFDESFDQGIAAYERGDFDESIRHFETLLEQGVAEPELFFNLGNAYYRTAQLAGAIANYERALQLDPGNPVVRENLARAVARTERSLPRPYPRGWEDAFFFWHGDLTGQKSLAVAALAWVAAWFFLAIRLKRNWPYLRAVATVCIALSLMFLGSWWVKSHPEEIAVSARERVPVRYGHRAAETVRFELYEGDRVRVDGRRGEWVRIETHDGERGWTEAAGLYFVGPPYTRFASGSAL